MALTMPRYGQTSTLHLDAEELPCCRICLQEGSLNIYDSSFDTDDGDIRIADALEEFSVIQVW